MEVVCLHGLGRTGADWAGVAPGLGRFGEVHAPTLPRDPLGAIAQARRLATPGAVLVGLSAGAVHALRIAADPAVAPAVRRPPRRADPGRRARPRSARTPPRHRDGDGIDDGPRRAPRTRPGPPRRCALPVLVVHARDDHHVPADFAEAAASGRRWTAHIVPGGGHHLHVTRPAEWLAAVVPWLDDQVPG